MKIQTSKLTRAALNWAVAKCEGKAQGHPPLGERTDLHEGVTPYGVAKHLHYSTDWALGGPIIEREGIDVSTMRNSQRWIAQLDTRVFTGYGETPLIAAMRCYVASKLGDTVDIPDELLEQA